MNESHDAIIVTIRNPGTGHTTAAIPLDALPALIDEHLAAGRWAVAESGEESLIVRVGRDIMDFFLGRRRAGEPKPKEEVTILNKMAGGQDENSGAMPPELMGEVLAVAVEARQGPRSYGGGQALPEGPPMPRAFSSTTRGAASLAELRAWQALLEKEGDGAMRLLRGGAVAVHSSLWPRQVVYLVKTEITLVVREGQIISRLCLQLADGAPLWDGVATRLSLLRAGSEGEAEVWATANAL